MTINDDFEFFKLFKNGIAEVEVDKEEYETRNTMNQGANILMEM